MSIALSLYPHQQEGVTYLKSRPKHALLWDEQRVGKTPQVIVASGEMGIKRVLVVTTVAGVGVWRHQWKQWDRWGRTPAIVPWSTMSKGGIGLSANAKCELLVLDEGHYAKSFGAERTRAVYGLLHGSQLLQHRALLPHAERVWHLTGTPAPHDPGDLYPTLRALFPEILAKSDRFPDVTTFERFRQRYCVIVQRRIGNRIIPVVVRGQHLDELQARLKGLFIRRRQDQVGIRPAFWDLLPIEISERERDKMFSDIDATVIKKMLEGGVLDQPHLAAVRRITGTYKANAIVRAATEFCDTYPDQKLVLAYWHKDVGDVLEAGLNKFGTVRVDGSITGDNRSACVQHFQTYDTCRIFLAQIAAAGEAIDLSASAEMWFVESTFTPAQMAQMGARITNLKQPKQCLVRVASLSDTIDELIQDRLVDLSRSIAHTLGEKYHENFAQH